MGLLTYLLPNLARIVQGHPVEILDYGGRLAHIGSQGFVNGLAALPLFDDIDELCDRVRQFVCHQEGCTGLFAMI